MTEIRRFSSRRQRLDQAFLTEKLRGARAYRRIAGYFRGSIFERVLQTLGTLINVDLPWNPARLEQRLGRIKRFGQARKTVDMLNLVYHDTQDEKVYEVLSRRMKDRYDISGSLPDTIEDEWIEGVEDLDKRMDEYIHLRNQARNAFEVRYQETIDPNRERCELCSRVLARRDVLDKMSEPW